MGHKGFSGLILYQFWRKSGVNRLTGSKDIAKNQYQGHVDLLFLNGSERF